MAGKALEGHRVGFLVPERVRRELQFHHKYSTGEVRAPEGPCRESCPPGAPGGPDTLAAACREFFNQNRLDDRKRLSPVLVRYPHAGGLPGDFTASWDQLAQLLYCSAVWHGGVVLAEAGTGNPLEREHVATLNGVWRGKEGTDWEAELVLASGGDPDLLASVFDEERVVRGALDRLS